MKIRNLICCALGIGLFAGCASEKGERERAAQLEVQAKVTKAEAELIWAFDIATPGTKDITEVAVDAISGEVVAIDKETPADEAKEKKKEKEEDEKDEKK